MTPDMRTIGEIATFVTSKNAGPFLLTLDIVFPDEPTYRRFVAGRSLDRATVAGLYGVEPEDVLDIIEFEPAFAVKITLRRPWPSGAVGESDVYGAQQHVPLAGHAVEWPETA
ncbi:MAG TPA: DUF4387 domain-containing protein [Candidatus Dormibacteraeota bacterium]|jgi:hypothetical protein|nr:DUF4387 domain-containing protein [Candidatus Dormibacteraeota bacterium]